MTDNQVMHKRQLVDEVARRSGPWGLTRRQVREALHGTLDVIIDEMAEGNAVTIAGFGRFEAREHKGRRTVEAGSGKARPEQGAGYSQRPGCLHAAKRALLWRLRTEDER